VCYTNKLDSKLDSICVCVSVTDAISPSFQPFSFGSGSTAKHGQHSACVHLVTHKTSVFSIT
jgi:hypothetical protein